MISNFLHCCTLFAKSLQQLRWIEDWNCRRAHYHQIQIDPTWTSREDMFLTSTGQGVFVGPLPSFLFVEIILWRDQNLKFPTKNFPCPPKFYLVDFSRATYFLLMRSYRRDDVRSWCHIGALTPSLLIPTIYKHGTLCWGASYFCH